MPAPMSERRAPTTPRPPRSPTRFLHRRLQMPEHGELQLAVDQAEQALALARLELQPGAQALDRPRLERPASSGQPARRGGAVNAIHGSERIDAQALAEMQA